MALENPRVNSLVKIIVVVAAFAVVVILGLSSFSA